MNKEIKNIFSFIKEVMELKNKNIYTLKDFNSHIDFRTFYKRYEEIIEPPEFEKLNVNSDETIFELKYINENKKKNIPTIPGVLRKYVSLKGGNDLVFINDKAESDMVDDGYHDIYIKFDKEIKEINRYNNLIDDYNRKYEDFYHIYKRITEYEEKLELVFGHNLLVWEDNDNNRIDRYIFEAQLDINVNIENNVISFKINKMKNRGLVNEFLNLEAYKTKEMTQLNSFIKKFNEEIDEEDIDLESAVIQYANYASFENEVVDRPINPLEDLKRNVTYIFNNCGLIVRSKNIKLWIDDIENILGVCAKEELLSPILKMFEIDFDDEEQIANILGDKLKTIDEEDNILFPLASNNEQYKIVDKVRGSNMVLVQGPPGTGKSHTIANLLSHYISQGKKVIVTSEKSKALEVLRDKIPESIRSLSLSVLNQNGVDKDLENSISAILKQQDDDIGKDKRKKKIIELEKTLELNREEKQKVMRQIIELMAKDNVSHKNELGKLIENSSDSDIKIMDIALWLDVNKKYDYIPETDIENYEYKDIDELFDKLEDILKDIRENNYAISSTVDVIDYLKTNEIELHIKEINGFNNYNIQNVDVINALKQNNLSEELVDELKYKIDNLSVLYDFFSKEQIIENIKFQPFNNQIKEISKLIEINKDYILLIEEKIFDNKLEMIDISTLENYSKVTSKMLSCYDSNGKINIIDKIKLSMEIKNLNGLKYNGSIITKDTLTFENLKVINEILNYHILIKKINNKLEQLLKIDLFSEFNIQENEFGKSFDNITSILKAFINYNSYVEEIDKGLDKLINRKVCPISYMDISDEKMSSILKDLRYYVTIKFGEDETNNIVNKIKEFYSSHNLHNLEKMLVSISNNKLEDFIEYKNKLNNEINIINQYNHIKELYSTVMNDKKTFIKKYIYNLSSDHREFVKENYNKIFKYHYVKKYYLEKEKKINLLPELFEKRKELISSEKKIITELVSAKGWDYQNQKMTLKISASLSKWLALKRKAKGKQKNLFLRKMNEEMNIAKNAIPVWIMPLDVLIEQYPFSNKPQFDVLIMDESSQSSVFSISALARAKKVIIVGDDKQISPSTAFTALDGFNELRSKYLKGSSWDLHLSKDTSIYDIIQMMCGTQKIALTEHFRCLPEIINYSNREFYDMSINPLKVRSKENTIKEPIKTVYVPNAVVRRFGGSKLANQKECDRIISLIEDISKDKSYNGKSIGIIALQNSDPYIKKLIDMVMKTFGEKFIKERKIKIGTTSEFQGDERDVIILGMVVSSIDINGEKYPFKSLSTLEFDRSFNVAASRAKEQMILVHSVQLEELNNSCNRYKLLNYCLNYDKEKEKEFEKTFESNFEKDIYEYLSSKNYSLVPQFKVGKYRLDFMLTNDKDQKIAIECDGDKYHGLDELSSDLERQGILERCGWKFVRIRASEFYYDREKSCKEMIEKIEEHLNSDMSVTLKFTPTPAIEEFDTIEKNDTVNKTEDFFSDYVCLNKKGTEFRYMTLYSEGVDKHEIADYYGVSYSSVKRALQDIAHEYEEEDIDHCIGYFLRDYSNTKEYINIIGYYKYKKSKTIESKNFKNELEKILKEEFSELYFEIKSDFIGWKFNKNDKYYMGYVNKFNIDDNNKFISVEFTFRKNINELDNNRKIYSDKKELLKEVREFITKMIENKPTSIKQLPE